MIEVNVIILLYVRNYINLDSHQSLNKKDMIKQIYELSCGQRGLVDFANRSGSRI